MLRVAREHIRPDAAAIVLVGDHDQFGAELAAQDVGGDKVRVVDSETASLAIAMLAHAIQRRLARGTTDEEISALVERFHTLGLPAQLHNLYGPTEAAVDVTAWHCRRDDRRDPIPIGRPIANVRMHVVDERGRQLQRLQRLPDRLVHGQGVRIDHQRFEQQLQRFLRPRARHGP